MCYGDKNIARPNLFHFFFCLNLGTLLENLIIRVKRPVLERRSSIFRPITFKDLLTNVLEVLARQMICRVVQS